MHTLPHLDLLQEASGQALYVRNVSFAVQQRMAFSSYLEGSSKEAEMQYYMREPLQVCEGIW